jgi:ribosomal protein S27E
VAEFRAVYRPRHPERTAFYRLLETRFDRCLRAYEERFAPRSGPLRPVVVRSVEDSLGCGRPEGGFARIRCPKCRAEHLLAFSCRTRNYCSSCQAKRAVLFAEKLIGGLLAPVPHHHGTFSIPRALRGLFVAGNLLVPSSVDLA